MIALTETPRTDAALIPDEVTWMEGIVTADFARQLERELASLADELRLARENEIHAAQQVIEWSQIATEEKEDARRYRWLRGRASISRADSWSEAKKLELMQIFEQPGVNFGDELSAGEHLDAAIDEALKEPR